MQLKKTKTKLLLTLFALISASSASADMIIGEIANSGQTYNADAYLVAPLYSNRTGADGVIDRSTILVRPTQPKTFTGDVFFNPTSAQGFSGMTAFPFDYDTGLDNKMKIPITTNIANSGTSIYIPNSQFSLSFWAKDEDAKTFAPFMFYNNNADEGGIYKGLVSKKYFWSFNSSTYYDMGIVSDTSLHRWTFKTVYDDWYCTPSACYAPTNLLEVYKDGVRVFRSAHELGQALRLLNSLFLGKTRMKDEVSGNFYTANHQSSLSCVRLYTGVIPLDVENLLQAEGPSCRYAWAPPVAGSSSSSSNSSTFTQCTDVNVPTFSGSTYSPILGWAGSSSPSLLNSSQYFGTNTSSLEWSVGNPSYYNYSYLFSAWKDDPVIANSGSLKDVIRDGVEVSWDTEDAVSINPLTWFNSATKFEGRNSLVYPNMIALDGTGITADIQLEVMYFLSWASSYLAPVNTFSGSSDIYWKTEYQKVTPLYSSVWKTGTLKFYSERPIAAFRYTFPASKHIQFHFTQLSATWATVKTTTCTSTYKNSIISTINSDWENKVWSSVSGAILPPLTQQVLPETSSWLSKIWVSDYTKSFFFAVPLTPSSVTGVLLPIPALQAGGRGLDLITVEARIDDVGTKPILWTGSVRNFGSSAFSAGGGTVAGSVVPQGNSLAKVFALLFALFYVFLRISIISLVFVGVSYLVGVIVVLANTFYPLVSDKLGKITLSAGWGGVSWIVSWAAWMVMVVALGSLLGQIFTASMYFYDFFASSVIPVVNFVVFALVRNFYADWTFFSLIVNLVWNTLFVAVTAYASWRVIYFIAKI